jgi:acyl-CoA dehydrogenase
LLYLRRAFWAWVAGLGIPLAYWSHVNAYPTAAFVLSGILALAALVLGLPVVRRPFLSGWIMRRMARVLPRMGDTERAALQAGTVWFDGDLFSGDPDWDGLLAFEPKQLSERERQFLEGPVEDVCRAVTEWDVVQRGDLPPEIWDFLKRERFFGMIIPEEHGGLGFSAAAHSAVIMKLASRSVTAAVTVMVPNSLGPAELLLHYGTDEQKHHYLPRLASGEEVPCFALTGPEAGSDAAATQSIGVVCRGTYEGREVLGMRMSWRKRYITLSSIATVIGLAFRLRDPDHLLGDREELGITCALVPAGLEGIEIGLRHDPMGVPFHNGPIVGRDVFVPLDFIIGGPAMAGQGWRMLMESLAVGRSISLPSLAVASAKLATRVVGAYATVREQFDTPIGRFEGIEEPLARIGGQTYFMDAARALTVGAVDAGEQPAVLSAVVKAYLTEGMRRITNDAMDVRAGAAIVRGPRNLISRQYQAVPIGITVEGANILTRSMIIYGQGAIRCHPFVQREMDAIAAGDVAAFDGAFVRHVGFVCANAARSLVLGLTNGRTAAVPRRARRRGEHGKGGADSAQLSRTTRRNLRRLTRMSTAFALVSDAAMATLGGQLKRREKLSGRLADALAWLYIGSATLKRYHDEGEPARDEPLAEWSCRHALFEVQRALQGIIDNFPLRPAAWALRVLVFPLGARYRPPSDRLGAEVARELLEDRDGRLALTRGIFIPDEDEIGLGRLEAALDSAVEALKVETKIRDAIRAGRLDRLPGEMILGHAMAAGVITEAERRTVLAADEIRDEVIQVDAFDSETFAGLRG